MIDDSILARCAAIATSSWSDALDKIRVGGVADGLTRRSGSGRIAGRAVTVFEHVAEFGTYTSEDFALGSVLAIGRPGDVLVVAMDGARVSTFGGLAARSAVAQGFIGVVLDGACRDVDDVQSSGLVVVSRHVTPRSGKGRVRIEEVNGAITCGGSRVSAGDLVVTDETGTVFIPTASVSAVLEVAERLAAKDRQFEDALDQGSTFDDAAKQLLHM